MTEHPITEEIEARTDAYFNRTRDIVARFGDARVTYAVFLRRPVISAPRLMLDWLQAVAAEQGFDLTLDVTHAEGEWVGAGEPLVYISGSFRHLSIAKRCSCRSLGRRAWPRTMPIKCASRCRPSASSPWRPGIVRGPRCRC